MMQLGRMDARTVVECTHIRVCSRMPASLTVVVWCSGEFRKYVERDAALERRFQPVHVHEPTAEHALTILEVTNAYGVLPPCFCNFIQVWKLELII